MESKLIKVAKELNVGTATIVEHLNKKGFEIENKPTAKVTEEMHQELLKEFQKSIAIKEQADQLIFGGSRSGTPHAPSVPGKEKLETPPAPTTQPEKPAAAKTESPAAKSEEQTAADSPDETLTRARTHQHKVVGKIDLSSRLKAKKQEEPAPPPPAKSKPEPPKAPAQPEQPETPPVKAAETAPPAEPPTPQAPAAVAPANEEPAKAPAKEEPVKEEAQPEAQAPPAAPPKDEPAEPAKAPEAEKPAANELMRAEAPELRGLKIVGKIDTNMLERPKRRKKKETKKEKEAPKPAAAEEKTRKPKPAEAPASDEDASKKRRRKRKKVAATDTTARATAAGRRRPSPEEEAKEVSQKEIEEKIRATMARISGGGKKKRQKQRRDNRDRLRERQEMREQEMTSDKLQLTEFVSVQELANLMDVAVTDVITTCLNLGVIVSINQRLDAEIIELVAEEFGHEVEFISVEEQLEDEDEIIDAPEDLLPRPPIVTVMGHVDHGKTSLLDYIRQAKVAEGEAGGITQHIGAYEVLVSDKKITFLDTPGHEAFTAMRARGAKVTDIAVIIIAADDSIMPQTKEAISHAQAANVPIVFAINKVDKPGAAPERIKQELASMNFLVEEWGGKYQSQDISAKTGQGIDELLEKILLEAELLELQANPDRKAVGTVIEASLDKGRGYVTKMLVQTGSLRIGDAIVAGEHSGKIKAMFNERGKRVKEVGPSTPVLVLGLNGAPQAGERFKVEDSEQDARQIASKRAQILREQANRATKRISLDEIGRRLALGNFQELNLIVKGDVDGSVEALSDSLIKQSIETVQVNVIHKAVGQIIESDVLLASASDAIIIGFQVRPSVSARKLAEREGVQIKLYSIIYEAIDEVRAAIEGMLEPTKEEKILGQVEVREVYKISKVGTVAGCYVQEGKILRNNNIRLIRDGIVIYPTREGQMAEIASLKRFKEDVREVKSGLECGISIKNFNDIKVGDVIEAYEIIEIKQKLAAN
jgi:translation initiation factor IF-2